MVKTTVFKVCVCVFMKETEKMKEHETEDIVQEKLNSPLLCNLQMQMTGNHCIK